MFQVLIQLLKQHLLLQDLITFQRLMEIVHSQLLRQQLLEAFLDHLLILQVIIQQSQSLLQLPQLLAVEAL